MPLLVIVARAVRAGQVAARPRLGRGEAAAAVAAHRCASCQHVVVWGIVVIAAAFLFQDSGSRTVFALALTTSLVAAIIMLSMVVVTGYVGQISLAQMSLAGVAAFFMARMMADGSTTSTNPFPVDGPGLAVADRRARRRRRRGRRRRRSSACRRCASAACSWPS